MSIPRRRRRSIRTVIADLESAIADLDARVDALEDIEDEWLLEEPAPWDRELCAYCNNTS